jgi:hypothetical protein
MALVALLLTFSLSAWSQSCPTAKTLSLLPVHDQDGMGTCASNTAALMMQHNLGLAKSPSFMQISITQSATDSENGDDFFFTDDGGKERVFNWGANICDVIESASKNGFCDYDQMGFNFVGTTDPRGTQQAFLVSVSRFFDQKEGSIRALKSQLNNPQTRAEAERRLAYFFSLSDSTCNVPPQEYLARRALSRMKVMWESYLVAPATNMQKTAARKLLDTAFHANGEPKAAALDYYKVFLSSESALEQRLDTVEQSNATATGLPGAMAESTFMRWWGEKNNIVTNSIPGTTTNFYVSDWRAYAPCRRPEIVRTLDKFLSAPFCEVPPTAALSPQVTAQEQQLVNSLQRLANNQLDPQAGLVNMLAPACAAQMSQRANDYSDNCKAENVNNDSQESAAKEKAIKEICAGRAMGLSICTGFFKSTTPIDSKHCDEDEPGVADHGRHGVTVIGYRPSSTGKRQFLVQNSWGNTCPFRQHPDNAVPAALQNLVECEVTSGATATPTGRFWVEEDLLFDNVYHYSTYVP